MRGARARRSGELPAQGGEEDRRAAPRRGLRRGARGWFLLLRTRPEKGLLGGMTEVPTTEWMRDFDDTTALGACAAEGEMAPHARRGHAHLHAFSARACRLCGAACRHAPQRPPECAGSPLADCARRSAAQRDAQGGFHGCFPRAEKFRAAKIFSRSCRRHIARVTLASRPRPNEAAASTGKRHASIATRNVHDRGRGRRACGGRADRPSHNGSRTRAIRIRTCRSSIRASPNTASDSRASNSSIPARAGAKARCGWATARCLLWSDIPNNRIMRWDEETGRTSVYRKPSNNANGNTRDRQGRLVTCEHDTRRVTRTEYDGTITVLADKFDGKPLNSPNDVVVKSDDSIWFTDPPFGILGNYEGHGDAGAADQRLSARPGTASSPPSRPATQPAERARVLARRVEALRGRGRARRRA